MQGKRSPRKGNPTNVNTTLDMLKKMKILSNEESQNMQLNSINYSLTNHNNSSHLLSPPQNLSQSPMKAKRQNVTSSSVTSPLNKSLANSTENPYSQIKKILRETLMVSPSVLPNCNQLTRIKNNNSTEWETWQFTQTAVTTPVLEYTKSSLHSSSEVNLGLVEILQKLFMNSDNKYGSGLIQLQQINQIIENQQVIYSHTLTEFLNGIMLLCLEILPYPSPKTHKLLLMSMMYKVGDSYSVNLVEEEKFTELKNYLSEFLFREDFRRMKICEFFYLVWDRFREEFTMSHKKDEEAILNLLGISKYKVFGKKNILENEFGLKLENLIEILTDYGLYDSISKSGLFNNGKNTAHPIYAVVEALSKNTSFYHTFKLLFTLCVNDLRLPITINQDEKISMKEKLKLNFNIHEVRFKNKPQEVKEFFDIFGLKSAIFEFIFYGKRDMIDQIYSPRVGMESKLTVKNEEKITIDDRKAEIKVQEQYDLFDEDQYTDFEAGGMEDYLASIPLDGQNYSSKMK